MIAPYIQVFGMRQLFPCWDIPHLKATFTISIKHQRDLKTLSNMPIKYNSSNRSLTAEVWTDFYTTPPMSTFQIAIVITKYQSIRISENITLWCEWCYSEERSLKFQFAQKIINNITLHLKSEFSEINIPKMDHIAIPNFPYHVTSKWGLIFHRYIYLHTHTHARARAHTVLNKLFTYIISKFIYFCIFIVFSTNWKE